LPSASPAVSVIVPAFNAAATIGDTLAALAEQDLEEPFEVLVVDDGSDDATARVVEGAPGNVRLSSHRWGGPGPARNAGAAAARAPVLAFTDADCIPTPSWLRQGLLALESADLVQGAVQPDPNARRRPFDRTIWVVGETGLYECANLFARRELFERLGGFDDWLGARIGKPLAEDAWFGWRARRTGARSAFERRALVHHAVFERTPRQYVAERVRLVYFPEIVAKMPELRRTMLYGRWFLSGRTLAFDLALGACAAAILGSRPWLLAGAVPYALLSGRQASRWRRRAPIVVVVDAVADAVSFTALLLGSVRRLNVVI